LPNYANIHPVLKRKTVYIAISFGLSFVLVWILLSRVQTQDLIQTLSRISFPALLAYMGIALAAAVLRALRYKWLLRPNKINWGNLMLVTFIRNSFVDLLPARIGALSYIYVLNRRLGFSFESATSSFILSGVFDFLTLSPFLVLSLMAVGFRSLAMSVPALLAIALIFFFIFFLVLWKMIAFSAFILRLYLALVGKFHLKDKKWATVSAEKFRATIESLREAKARKTDLPLFLLSLLVRLGKYISIYFLLFALLRSHGFTLQSLSLWKLILGITGAELTSALPVKGIAGFGTWESAWALTFALMNFDQSLAIISGIGIHLITNLFEYSLGIGSLLILALPWARKPRNDRPLKQEVV
jgi:uncharacterized membrane protein YbhN (UPF0104 family)